MRFFSEPSAVMGGRNMIVLDDLLQLSPVSHGPVFSDLTAVEKDKLNAIFTVNLWNSIKFDELTENVRQLGDPRYAKLLKDVRVCMIDQEDEKWLLDKCLFRYASRSPEAQRQEIADFVLKEMTNGHDYTILVPTNAMAAQLNASILDSMPGRKYVLEAIDSIAFRHSTEALDKATKLKVKKLEEDARQTAGLESSLVVKMDCRVMLRRNLDVARGLCNGAIGQVKGFTVLPSNRKRVESIIVQFENDQEEIKRVSSDFFIPCSRRQIKIQRTQFPVILAAAMTVHKCKGLTLDYAMIDCGKDIFDRGQIYVALSRVRTHENLRILNYNSARLKACLRAMSEYRRLGSKEEMSTSTPVMMRTKRKCTQVQVNYTSKKPKLMLVDEMVPATIPQMNAVIGTFLNSEGNFCYANASVRCLLALIPHHILSKLKDFKTIIEKFHSDVVQSLDALRHDIKHGFQLDRKGDPEEFLQLLLQNRHYNGLYPHFLVTVDVKFLCSNGNCGKIVSSLVSENAIIELQATTENRTVLQMLQDYERDESTDRRCTDCRHLIKQSKHIVSSFKYFVARILPVSNDGVIKEPTLIKRIPDCILTIAGKRFKFNSLVRHHGDLEALAHYVALIKREKKWISVSDTDVQPQSKWPTNGYDHYNDLKKSPYLLFYSIA